MAEAPSSDKEYGLTIMLAVLLGPFGAHRCYCGRPATGLLQGAGTVAALGWCFWGLSHSAFSVERFDVWPLIAPLAALFVWGLWPVVDVVQLMRGRFRDGRGALVRA